jgi:hypothetical protein
VATLVDSTGALTARVLSHLGDRLAIALGRSDPDRPGSRVCWVARLDLHAATRMDAPRHFVSVGADIARTELGMSSAVIVRTGLRRVLADALTKAELEGRAVPFDTGWAVSPETSECFEDSPHVSAERASTRRPGSGSCRDRYAERRSAGYRWRVPRAPHPPRVGVPVFAGLRSLHRLLEGAGSSRFGALPLKLEEADGTPACAVAEVQLK